LHCHQKKKKEKKKKTHKNLQGMIIFSAAQPSPAQNHPKRGWELEPRLGPPPLPCHEKKRDPVTNMTRGYTSHG